MKRTLWLTTNEQSIPEMTEEDWLNQGKSDAWAGKPKLLPEENVIAASMYDLGYSEGGIEPAPTINHHHQ